MIIGITGLARSGKTTVAEILCDEFGYERKHIAAPLREMLVYLFYRAGIRTTERDAYLTGSKKEDIIPFFGVTSRHMQVTLGTEWGRRLVNPNIWVDLWKVGLTTGSKVINDSVRFPNEENAIRELDGIIIKVIRPGVEPNVFRFGNFGRQLYRRTRLKWFIHESERVDRINADITIVNDGTIEDLRGKVRAAIIRRQQLTPQESSRNDRYWG